jgi:hypothetical protein
MARALPHVAAADWVLHIDADEYLNVTIGNRQVDDLINLFPTVDAIAIQWRHFGSAGQATWQGGSVVETFTQSEEVLPVPGAFGQVGFKTLFRPGKFHMIGVHTPKMPLRRRSVPVAVNTAGTTMPTDAMMTKRNSGYPTAVAAQCTWENACLHHHHVKSDDLHLLKHTRGDANGRLNSKREIASDFYRLVNRNEVECRSLVPFRDKVAPIEVMIRGLPGVAELEAAAMDWFAERFRKTVALPALAEQEQSALEWLAARMAEVRVSSGAEQFETAAVDWFRRTLIRLQAGAEATAEAGSEAGADDAAPVDRTDRFVA